MKSNTVFGAGLNSNVSIRAGRLAMLATQKDRHLSLISGPGELSPTAISACQSHRSAAQRTHGHRRVGQRVPREPGGAKVPRYAHLGIQHPTPWGPGTWVYPNLKARALGP